MKKLLLTLALTFAPSLAFGQCNGIFPPNTVCGNLSGSPAPPSAFSAGSGTIVGPGSSTINDVVTWANVGGSQIKDSGVPISNIPLLGSNNTFTGANNFAGVNATSIGAITPGTGSFTTLSASSTISGTGFSAYLASPPPIGSTAQNTGAFTTLNAQTFTNLGGGGLGTFPLNVHAATNMNAAFFQAGSAFNISACNDACNALVPFTILSTKTTFLTPAAFVGSPYTDITSGGTGCAIADSTGASDSTAAIQCYLNYMNSTYSGGIVFAPCGTYLVSAGGVTIKGGTMLVGCGQNSTTIKVTTDSAVITFDQSGGGGTCSRSAGMQGIFVQGYANAAATTNAVTVGTNCPAILRDNTIWFGASALFTKGQDGRYYNNFICGYNNSVLSQGANFYADNKFDSCGTTQVNGFNQGTCLFALCENTFQGGDFSGSYTDSLLVNDTVSVLKCLGCIFSNSIVITNARATLLLGVEIGGAVTTNSTGQVSISGSMSFSPVTVTGSATRQCAANIAITC